jgi:hypothetical protein
MFHVSFICRLGCHDFTDPLAVPTPESGASHSLFFPDEAIFQGHPRFKTLTRNIRQRRGSKVAINLPSEFSFTLEQHSPHHMFLHTVKFQLYNAILSSSPLSLSVTK